MDMIKSNIRMVLYVAGGQGVTMHQFPMEYREITGQKLDISSAGFDSLEQLMKSIPDVVHLEKDTHTGEIVFVAKEHAVHWMSDDEHETPLNQSDDNEDS